MEAYYADFKTFAASTEFSLQGIGMGGTLTYAAFIVGNRNLMRLPCARGVR